MTEHVDPAAVGERFTTRVCTGLCTVIIANEKLWSCPLQTIQKVTADLYQENERQQCSSGLLTLY